MIIESRLHKPKRLLTARLSCGLPASVIIAINKYPKKSLHGLEKLAYNQFARDPLFIVPLDRESPFSFAQC